MWRHVATLKPDLKRQALLHICMDVFLKNRLARACTWDSAYKLVRTFGWKSSHPGKHMGIPIAQLCL